MAIVVCGRISDPHVAWVVEKLCTRGRDVVVLDHETSPPFSLTLDRKGVSCLLFENTPIDVSVVWDRLKLRQFNSVVSDDDRARYVTISEWLGLYREFSDLYSDRVINTPAAKFFCRSKLRQQQLMAQFGIPGPTSLVGNQKTDFLLFARDHSNLIAKCMGSQNAPSSKDAFEVGIMTTSLNEEILTRFDEGQFMVCPTLSQERIDKQYELRIVAVHEQTFAFRIESQQHRSTSVDWRYGNDLLEFYPYELPAHIFDAITQFMTVTDLSYGVFDLIREKSGGYVFLECNSDGQWGWLDAIVDGGISDAFADMLEDADRATTKNEA